ncbi:hypothetical protein, partial [Nocardia farcinica]|uniref:hypothetical protein n=1 Tax=Nocardia farcinica TaxID=37329 RepID=UPI00245420B1
AQRGGYLALAGGSGLLFQHYPDPLGVSLGPGRGRPGGRGPPGVVARPKPTRRAAAQALAAALKYWTVAFPPEPFWIMRLVPRTDGGGQRS